MVTPFLISAMGMAAFYITGPKRHPGRKTLVSLALGGAFGWSVGNDWYVMLNALVLVGAIFSLAWQDEERIIYATGVITITLGVLGTLFVLFAIELISGFFTLILLSMSPTDEALNVRASSPWGLLLSIGFQLVVLIVRFAIANLMRRQYEPYATSL